MIKNYLFIKVDDPHSSLARELQRNLAFNGSYYFTNSLSMEDYQLRYNSLFEKDGEYSAFARINPDTARFEFKSDYWNMLAHYCFEQDGVRLMSNDSLWLARLTKSRIGMNAVYDSLIFGRPYNAGSYFENVRKLPPCKYGYINLVEEDVEIHMVDYPFWRDLLDDYKGDLIGQFIDDFLRAKGILGNDEVVLQFSGGSDSTTIFNALKYFNVRFKCASFSKSRSTDSRVKNFGRHFSINNNIYVAIENEESDKMAIELSAGLAPTSRFASFYSQIEPSIMFDGYNICKGDYSDASIHPALRSLWLTEGLPGLEDNYPEFPSEFLKDLYDYWLSIYSKNFIDINTEKGLTQFQNYAMDYVIPIINGGINLPAIQMDHSVQSYYLTMPFIFGAFNTGSGIARTVSIRNDYPGYRQSVLLLAKINNNLDKDVYNYVMDRNLSFREIDQWKNHQKLLYYSRLLKKKLIRAFSGRNRGKEPDLFDLFYFPQDVDAKTSNIRLKSLDIILSSLQEIVQT